MTTTITAASLEPLIGNPGLTAAVAEAILDHAINKINSYGASVNNLTGTAGSKTGTYSSQEAGFILDVAISIYAVNYKTSGSSSHSESAGGLSFSESSSTSSQNINTIAKEAATYLCGRTFVRA